MCKNSTTPILEYNPDTKSAILTTEFTASQDTHPTRKLTMDTIIGVFQQLLIALLQARLTACYQSVEKCSNSITQICEWGISYVKNGVLRHYSFNAAQVMKSAIDKLKKQDYDFTQAELLQMLKALQWADDRSDKGGVPFQVLVDVLWEDISFKASQAEHQRNLGLIKDMDGTGQALDEARKENEALKQSCAILSKQVENLQATLMQITSLANVQK